MSPSPLRTLAALASLTYGQAAAQSDWLHWRGPNQDGQAAADARPPLKWGEDSNIRYKVPLPGLGCSSPIIRGDRIYLTTAIDLETLPEGTLPKAAGPQPERPNAEHQHQFLVLALDRATGKEVWRRVVHTAKPHEKGHAMGSHASASVLTSGDRILAFFGSRGLFALDLKGRVVWSKQFGTMKTLAGFGEGSTPALHGNTVIVQWDEEGPSFVVAFDVRDGKELWRKDRNHDSSWGTPLVTMVDKSPQVILTGSDVTRAYDLASGDPVWWCGGMSKNPVNSALVADGTAFVMNSYKGRILQAIRIAGAKGDLTGSDAVLWTAKQNPSYVPPPVLVDGNLYYLRDSQGILTCRNAKTGELVYSRKRIPGVKRIHASPIVAHGRIYIAARSGKTVVIQPGEEFQVLATNTLADTIDATPAFVGTDVFIRARRHLYRIGK